MNALLKGYTIPVMFPKFSDRQSDQRLHCLPFRLHLLDAFHYG